MNGVKEMELVERQPLTLVLIDLSSIAYPIWHTSQSDANPNAASQAIVARIRSLTSGQPHVAICCDKGRSFRHDLAPSYKANRPEHEAMLHHQIRLAKETLDRDGFPIWEAEGFEADDLIASAACKAAEFEHAEVLVVSADKDLLQLVGPTVTAISVKDGSRVDDAAVLVKFGVKPTQMRDYLTLVGDASDNIKGAPGIGKVKAAELLTTYGTLAHVYDELGQHPTKFKPSIATALKDLYPRLETVQQLITLRTDADLPFDSILRERQPRDLPSFDFDEDTMTDIGHVEAESTNAAETHAAPTLAPVTTMAVREAEVLAPAPAEWEKQLEPRSMGETIKLAKYVFDSRLFSAYGTPQAVMTTLLAGRELGLQSMASLRAIHIIDGKPTLSADLIRALIIRSGLAGYFRCTERSAERATFETKRGDDPPIALTFTIQEARAAWTKKPDAWDASGWGKNPADMLVARAGAKLARLVYPDVVHGIYTPEEIEENRQAVA